MFDFSKTCFTSENHRYLPVTIIPPAFTLQVASEPSLTRQQWTDYLQVNGTRMTHIHRRNAEVFHLKCDITSNLPIQFVYLHIFTYIFVLFICSFDCLQIMLFVLLKGLPMKCPIIQPFHCLF